MSGLRAELSHIDHQIECLSREINESLRSLGFRQHLEDVSSVSRPRHVTSTPDTRHTITRHSIDDVNSRYMSGVDDRERDNSSPTSLQPVYNRGMFPEIDRYRAQDRPKHRNFVKPATYDGSGQWNDYLSHFESVSLLNEWDEMEKGLYLAASLRGLAQGVLGNQPRGERQSYAKLVKALQDRFSPLNQTELYRTQLRERKQRASESLPELGQDIRRLVNLAYPTAPDDVREILASEQFLDGLHNSEMRIKIKQTRPGCLNEAIQRAVELEAYYKAERRRTENIRTMEQQDVTQASKIDKFIDTMQKNMEFLQREIKDIKQWKFYMQKKGQSPQQKAQEQQKTEESVGKLRKCFRCGSDQHLKRECPLEMNARDKEAKNTSRNWKSDQTQGNEKKKGMHSRVVCSVNEAGAYITAKLHGMDTYLLVDTGATVSLLSKTCYENIQGEENYELKSVDKEVLSANSSVIEIYGKTSVKFSLNETSLQHDMIIADISVDGILGLDFLTKHKAIINLRNHQIDISGIQHSLQLEGTAHEYKVALVRRIVVPPRSEIITEGAICPGPDGGYPVKVGLVEPSDKFLRSDFGMLAKTLVRRQDKIPLRIMNLSDTSKTIEMGTAVGKLSPVDEVLAVPSQSLECDGSEPIADHLKELFARSTEHLNQDQKVKAKRLINKYADLFAVSDKDMCRTSLAKRKINTGVQTPIKQQPRRLPFRMQDEVKEHVSDMLQRGIIKPSHSPWSSAIVLVRKKDGSTRFCVDYRRLNSVTTKDAYPLPRIDESLNQLRGCKWFCTLDLNAGYWQVELDPDDKDKTAFVTREGLYEFNVMPFGLCNAPATFERLMETVLSGLQWQVCLIYLDDVIVYGKTFEEMLHNLELVFEKLFSAGLKLKARKCVLFGKQVKYLGHIISEHGIQTDPEKIETVKNWPEPVNRTQVRSFIGLASYYRKFIANFAQIAQPLHKLTQASVPFKWNNECQSAFELLKHRLTSAPILTHPDFTQSFILDTDASQNAIGAALSQVQDGKERVVAYASKVLSKSEKKYCVTRKELLAVVTFIKHFRPFLYGHKFLVRTDHSSLKWLLRFKDPEGQLARWLEVISAYDMEIEHRAGKLHGNADGLGRIPCNQCGYFDDWDRTSVSTDHVRVIEEESSEDSESFDLVTMQEECADIRLVKSWVQNEKRPDYSDIASASYVVK